MSSPKNWLFIGGIMAALAVAFGAFAAHGIEGTLQKVHKDAEPKTVVGFEMPASYKYLQDFKTAARYHMYHALGLIALGLIAQGKPQKSDTIAAWSFLLGIILFCGSLYVLALTGMKWLGMVAPVGGLLMIVAWVALAISCKRPAPD
jgi:uncharacterized membrane protein YgdD (TMEM256/DUF423 family)